MENPAMKTFLRFAVSAAAVSAVLGLTPVAQTFIAGPALAQDHAEGDGHTGGQGSGAGGAGGSGGHEDGHTEGDHDDGHESGGKGGQGGSGEGGTQAQRGGQGESDGNGERRGQDAQSQTRPVWAQEGIPEIELGRLNVARAPSEVIDRAYAEALGAMTSDVTAFYALSLDQMEATLRDNWDTVRLIDSPLQNLALLRDALDGTSVLVTSGVSSNNDALLAAFLGTASDKTIPITKETALAVSAILGQPLTEEKASALAKDAERIRAAILDGHG